MISMARFTLTELNTLERSRFIACLSDIYEHSPWVAECASLQRPYHTVAELATAMQTCVIGADAAAQLRLIRAHPELAGKLAMQGELTLASLSEQTGAGLHNCTATELSSLTALNLAYRQKFDFPFIIAVRGLTRTDIIQALKIRLTCTVQKEIQTALDEIGHIARFRLLDRIAD